MSAHEFIPQSREPASATRLDVQLMSRFTDHNCTVWRISWNLTGSILASSGDDGYVRMWKSMCEREFGALHINNICFVSILQWTIWNNGNARQFWNKMAQYPWKTNQRRQRRQQIRPHWPRRNTTKKEIWVTRTKFYSISKSTNGINQLISLSLSINGFPRNWYWQLRNAITCIHFNRWVTAQIKSISQTNLSYLSVSINKIVLIRGSANEF